VTDWGTQIAIGSDGSTFPTNDGFIQIGNEFIYYGTKTLSGASYLLTNLQRGWAHTVEAGHSNGDRVTDMTNSAEDKKYKIELLRIRGGTIYIWWRNHRYEGLITKLTFTDSKEQHTGGLSRVTRYKLMITFRIGTMS